ncbi:MAG TPA: ATP-grasp domain-containing protein [Gaiellaceae bacterium]|nr:ATP-grasp domain-containing protein [Gaiellaceae bacterium]
MAGNPAAGGKRLLVLGAGPGQLGLLEAARARGLYVIAADRNPSAPGFRFADRRAIISVEDEPQLDRLAGAEHVDGVIAPGIDWPVAIAARIAERWGLPHPIDPPTAVLATSKLRQRDRFAEAGVPHPRHVVCATLDEAAAAADDFGYPCVVKAPDRQGQKGLVLVRDESMLADAFALALGASRSNVVLMEELVTGREVTVSGFSLDGTFVPLTVTDRLVAEPPAFGVALAHVWPSSLSPAEAEVAVDAARAAAEAVGVRRGPTYIQVVVGERGAHVVELAARLGGGHDAELCTVALGVDANQLALDAALGAPVDAERLRPTGPAGGACVRFLVPEPGVLEDVLGVAEAEALPGIGWVRVYPEPGAVLTTLRRGADRAGAVLAVGESREQALERAGRAADCVRLVVADAAEALV